MSCKTDPNAKHFTGCYCHEENHQQEIQALNSILDEAVAALDWSKKNNGHLNCLCRLCKTVLRVEHLRFYLLEKMNRARVQRYEWT